MNPPVLARLQCQDNGQRQAGFHRKRSRLHGFSQTLFPGCWAPHPVEIKSFGLGHGAKVAIAAGHGLGVPGRVSLSTGELGRTPSTLQEPWKAVPPGKPPGRVSSLQVCGAGGQRGQQKGPRAPLVLGKAAQTPARALGRKRPGAGSSLRGSISQDIQSPGQANREVGQHQQSCFWTRFHTPSCGLPQPSPDCHTQP